MTLKGWNYLTAKSNYIPEKQDIIWIDFDPSVGREIQKRRPAVVVSRKEYSERTGFVAVCPVTHGQKKLGKLGLLGPVLLSELDGAENPLQLYTFDFLERQAQKITTMDTPSFQKVVQLYNFIFEAWIDQAEAERLGFLYFQRLAGYVHKCPYLPTCCKQQIQNNRLLNIPYFLIIL